MASGSGESGMALAAATHEAASAPELGYHENGDQQV